MTEAGPDVAAIQRRTMRVLVLAQLCGGAGLAAGVGVGALLAEELLGSTSGAGLPAALFTGGSAAAAVVVGRISDRRGRRVGLTAGYLAGAVGGATVVIAAALDSVVLLLPALFVYGAGFATNLQCRYAGADLAEPDQRGRAISTVLVATTFGAVAGPNLLRQTGELALDVGLPRLAGPFVMAAGAYAAAAAILGTLLRPDPLLVARQVAADGRAPEQRSPVAPATRQSATAIVLAASGMVLAQTVMVAVMTMTPVHLEHHHHDLSVVGLVIALHIGFMYMPSPLTGALVDRRGPMPITLAGAAVLVAAGLVASTAGASAGVLAVALALLGLGWNLTLVGGTAQVTALTSLAERARTQGLVDVGVALAGAAAGLSSGAILAATSFETLAVLAAILAACVVPTTAAGHRRPRPCQPTG